MAELESKTIHSVAKAIHLLDLLTAGGQPASLTELYQKTGWPKSTIHGLLSTMRESGLIEQNANMALKIADLAYVLETGTITMSGTGAELLADEKVKEAYLGKKRGK